MRPPDPDNAEFLLRACHDLRTPLRAIRAHAELLIKNGDLPRNSNPEQSLAFIVEGARKMDSLVEGLAAYSLALQTGSRSFLLMPLGALLRNVLAKLDREIRVNGAEVTYDELPRVSGDPDRLMQLFENLLRNALRHRGQAPPRIHISAATHAEGWLFALRDNGPGIEAANLESIFQPFRRVHSGEPAGPGLGLAVCRAIVERHGGRIWAESRYGEGCTFLFTLPDVGMTTA